MAFSSGGFGTPNQLQTNPNDVRTVIMPLVAGNNIIAHNLNSSGVEVEVRNNATGAIITARIVAEGVDDVTIFVPVAVASARIRLDS